jgi:hypothetical protein
MLVAFRCLDCASDTRRERLREARDAISRAAWASRCPPTTHSPGATDEVAASVSTTRACDVTGRVRASLRLQCCARARRCFGASESGIGSREEGGQGRVARTDLCLAVSRGREEGRRHSLLGDSGHVDMLGAVVRHCVGGGARQEGSGWLRRRGPTHTRREGESGETREGRAVSLGSIPPHCARARTHLGSSGRLRVTREKAVAPRQAAPLSPRLPPEQGLTFTVSSFKPCLKLQTAGVPRCYTEA